MSPGAVVVLDDEHLGVLGHLDLVGNAVRMDLVHVQKDYLGAEAALVPRHLRQLLPVVSELGGVGTDGEPVEGPRVVPHPLHGDALAAYPAEVGASLRYVVAERPLFFRHLVRIYPNKVIEDRGWRTA